MADIQKGPYAQAVLHFQLNFPSDYPRSPPLLTFQSEIFHPLVTPLTTYTYPTGPRNSDSTSINDGDQLPPGGLSLRHGFPKWFQRSENSGRSQVFDSKGEQRQYNESLRIGSFAADGKGSTSPVASDNGIERVSEPFQLKSPPTWMSCDSDILGVLQYLKSVLEDEDLLDRLDLQASANTGAWRAWQAHRGISREANVPPDNQTNGIPPSQASVVSVGKGVVSSQRPPTAWNWDGVWANRVRKAVDVSTSDSVLYSNGNSNEVVSVFSCSILDFD